MRFTKNNYLVEGLEKTELPAMMRIRQKFTADSIRNPAAFLRERMRFDLPEDVTAALKGKRIGITAGSRGIPCYMEMLRSVVGQLREWGAEPFLFPAMGSHAGATGEGQKMYLEQFGITEENIGAPILSSMDVEVVARLEDGFPVYCDKTAAQADGIILFHKIKPHTHFKAKHESGLLKMICIGVGKHKGAAAFHQYGFDDFCRNMERVSKAFLEHVNVVFAIGLVQNAYDDIGYMEVIPREEIISRDAALLEIAKRSMPRLLMPEIDVLVIDEIGKEISGVGFDPNITGRTDVTSQQEAFRALAPRISKIVLLDITKASHGLAIGMGNADIASLRFANKIDYCSTFTNVITNNYLQSAATPLFANSDLDALRIALITSMVRDQSAAKVVRIKNTLSLSEIEVSRSLYEEMKGDPNIETIIETPYKWSFNEEGNLW